MSTVVANKLIISMWTKVQVVNDSGIIIIGIFPVLINPSVNSKQVYVL